MTLPDDPIPPTVDLGVALACLLVVLCAVAVSEVMDAYDPPPVWAPGGGL